MIRQSLLSYGSPLAATTAPLPEPKDSEVLLKVSSCGVCHSDLHLQDGFFDLGDGKRLDIAAGRKLPFTLGHEISGHVESAGPEAGDIDRSTFYVAYPWCGCGDCERCRKDEEHLCDAPRQLGINVDGGYASHVLVPHPRYLIEAEAVRRHSRREAAPAPCDHAGVGPSDRESWLLREKYPTGTARGWRRTGCFVMMIGALALGLLTIVVSIVAAVQ